MTLQEVTRLHIIKTLEECGGNKTQAAKVLGVHRQSLQRMIWQDAELDLYCQKWSKQETLGL